MHFANKDEAIRGLKILIFCVVILVAVASTPSLAFKRILPAGGELIISEVTRYPDVQPDVLVFHDNRILFGWSGYNEAVYAPDLYARLYDLNSGLLGPELLLTVPSGDDDIEEATLSLVPLTDETFAVVWTGEGYDGDDSGVLLKYYRDAVTGLEPITGNILVNRTTVGEQSQPSITPHPQGGVVVVWRDGGSVGGGGGTHVYARQFDALGRPVTGEVEVPESGTIYRPGLPEIESLSDGRFVVTWSSQLGEDGDEDSVQFRFMTSDVRPTGSQFRANDKTAGNQHASDIAQQSDSSILVAWRDQSYGNPSVGAQIYGRRFSSNGLASGPSFVISNVKLRGDNESVHLAKRPNGSLIITWSNRTGDVENSLHLVLVEADTISPTMPIQVNSTPPGTARSRKHAVRSAAISDTEFIAVWDGLAEADEGQAIYSQAFCVFGDTNTLCGDATCPVATEQEEITAKDALFTLLAAIDAFSCPLCICDVDSSGVVSATDALAVLRTSTGLSASLQCPACS